VRRPGRRSRTPGRALDEIDLVLVATSTPDQTFPATATAVQAELGITRGAAFDVQAVCSGFVYALTTADAFIRSGQATNVLVIGAETFSRILDWTDRTTCVLFGDGAGAMVVKAWHPAAISATAASSPVACAPTGATADKLYVDGGVSSTGTVGHLRMEGREVFKHAIVNMTSIMDETMAAAGAKPDDVDWFVPHQANIRILEGTARKFGIETGRVVITVDKHGNTSAASVPLALDVAVKDGRIKRGDLVLMEAMGGGFTWGAVLVRW
jgi:3-oxoacyl-[acyl-carrier-protein] synthase III